MKHSEKSSIIAGILLLLLASYFTISLMIAFVAFDTSLVVSKIFFIGRILKIAYGISSLCIPIVLFASAIVLFSSNFKPRNAVLLGSSILPFFTVYASERVLLKILPDSILPIFILKLSATIILALLLIVIEYVAAGVLFDSIFASILKKKENSKDENFKNENPNKEKLHFSDKIIEENADENFSKKDVEEKNEDLEKSENKIFAENKNENPKKDEIFEKNLTLDDIANVKFSEKISDNTEEKENLVEENETEIENKEDFPNKEDFANKDENESENLPKFDYSSLYQTNNEESKFLNDPFNEKEISQMDEDELDEEIKNIFSSPVKNEDFDSEILENEESLQESDVESADFSEIQDENLKEKIEEENANENEKENEVYEISLNKKEENSIIVDFENKKVLSEEEKMNLAVPLMSIKLGEDDDEDEKEIEEFSEEEKFDEKKSFENENLQENVEEFSEIDEIQQENLQEEKNNKIEEVDISEFDNLFDDEENADENSNEIYDFDTKIEIDEKIELPKEKNLDENTREITLFADELYEDDDIIFENEDKKEKSEDEQNFIDGQDEEKDLDEDFLEENDKDDESDEEKIEFNENSVEEIDENLEIEEENQDEIQDEEKTEIFEQKNQIIQKKINNRPYEIPTENVLTSYPNGEYWIIDEETKRAAVKLKAILNEFKIEAEVTGIKKGPVVTMFELVPAPGVKLSKIVALSDNIALGLAASSVRIVAPIPGKSAVGIEIPNKERSIVSFKEIIETENPSFKKMAIPVVLGKDITGDAKVIDLAKTPHLLIAGATGAGKSVCVNSLILSILYKRSPRDVKMILIDPKVVELKLYNDIPHLLTPVITEPKKAFQALQYCLCEMERRYACLDGMGVRDLESYNRRIVERHIATEKMPYIVVVIDEFADLMATTGKELESTIARLAAMSRAVGIHLVLATQRPSIDVITGLIKANIPTRIAFMVASKTDSRIIIDQIGADKLLGKGDMLYASATDPFPIRIQGTFVSDNEVENVVSYVKQYGEPEYIDDEIFVEDDDDDDLGASLFSDGEDPLYNQALEIVVQAGKASASYIQRRLKIGYNRAARLIEEMEARGIVGPQNGSKPREIIHIP